MVRVGLVGEDPNDTSSVRNLLSRIYADKNLYFQLMLKGIRGHQLDHPKTIRALEQETKKAACKLIVFIRDLDGFETQRDLIERKEGWFNKLRTGSDVLLLNIWELEALILGDIATFNKQYGSNINFTGDPMKQKAPKEFLKSKTAKCNKKYKESHAPDLFNLLNTDLLYKNCRFFKEFLKKFEEKL